MKNYSKQFERDYEFYLKSIGVFDFCGTLNPKFEAIPIDTGLSAKEVFYSIESEGKNKPCNQPDLLNQLLLIKASVNFQIKEWVKGRADGTLPLVEFSKRQFAIEYPKYFKMMDIDSISVLEWMNNDPVYHKDIETQYGLPEWVVKAVENQKQKYIQ